MNTRGTRNSIGSGRDGAILGMMLVMVAALSLIGWGLLQLGTLNGVEVSRNVNRDKAFWAAEAGLSHVRAKLGSDSNYRNFPTMLDGGGVLPYKAVVAGGGGNYTITSTGTVFGTARVVRQTVTVELGWPPAFDYSLFSGGTMKIAKDTSITGDGVNGDVYADGGFAGGSKEPSTNNSTIYDGVAGGYPDPSPVPPVPVIDQSYYNTQIAQAALSVHTTYPASLGGGTYDVKQGITITTPISGSGTLVVNGPVTITTGAVIGNGITIIANGPLSISSTPTLGSNDVFYSAASISIAKDNTFSAGNSALITPGTIDIQKTFTFSGLIFAGTGITMDKATGTTATITGCVVTGGNLTMKKDFNIIYDSSQLPASVMPGFIPKVAVIDGVWSEVFQ